MSNYRNKYLHGQQKHVFSHAFLCLFQNQIGVCSKARLVRVTCIPTQVISLLLWQMMALKILKLMTTLWVQWELNPCLCSCRSCMCSCFRTCWWSPGPSPRTSSCAISFTGSPSPSGIWSGKTCGTERPASEDPSEEPSATTSAVSPRRARHTNALKLQRKGHV